MTIPVNTKSLKTLANMIPEPKSRESVKKAISVYDVLRAVLSEREATLFLDAFLDRSLGPSRGLVRTVLSWIIRRCSQTVPPSSVLSVFNTLLEGGFIDDTYRLEVFFGNASNDSDLHEYDNDLAAIVKGLDVKLIFIARSVNAV